MLWPGDTRTRSLPRQIRRQVISLCRLPARQLCGIGAHMRLIHARNHAALHLFLDGTHAVERLDVVENALIEEVIPRHGRILPVDARRIIKTAAEAHKDCEKSQSHYQQRGKRRLPAPRSQLRQRPGPTSQEQGPQDIPTACRKADGQCQSPGQAILLHHRPEKCRAIIMPALHNLHAIGLTEFRIVREACHEKHRQHEGHQRPPNEAQAPQLQARCKELRQCRRNKGEHHDTARALQREAQARPVRLPDSRPACAGCDILMLQPHEKHTVKTEQEQHKREELQITLDIVIKTR